MTSRKPAAALYAALFAFAALFAATAPPAQALSLNQWSVSCGADRGAIRREGKTWVFRTSSNLCKGGIFHQRAELSTKKIAPSRKGTYQFVSHVSMTSPSREKYGLFQIHDGRFGCSPPLKLDVMPDGHLQFDSDYKIGTDPGSVPGVNCIKNTSLSTSRSKAVLRRDGTEYELAVTVSFDGKGGFGILVAVDSVTQLTGRYAYEPGRGFFKSKHFYFKHGVYSQHMFPYEMRSRDMTVTKLRTGG